MRDVKGRKGAAKRVPAEEMEVHDLKQRALLTPTFPGPKRSDWKCKEGPGLARAAERD